MIRRAMIADLPWYAEISKYWDLLNTMTNNSGNPLLYEPFFTTKRSGVWDYTITNCWGIQIKTVDCSQFNRPIQMSHYGNLNLSDI